MKTVKFDVTFKEPASRVELFVRMVWAIPTAIVMIVLAIIAAIASVLQWFHILFVGKRHKALHGWIYKFLVYVVKYEAYKDMLTDERSPIMPED
ncbi:Uncharacterised protein [uncultured archaeon]|nr:Uncharacterised protein [uncultured archaeon]